VFFTALIYGGDTVRLDKQDKKHFYKLLFPALIEGVLSQLFHIADSIMLGQMTNSTVSVAAVGMCVAPVNLIVSVSNALFIGTTATVAWYYGAKQKDNMRTAAWQSMGIAVPVALFASLVSIIFAEPLMRFICGESEILEVAASYFRINAYGFFFQIVTFNITAILRGIGVSKTPMIYNLTGGVVNVILNYILIYGKFGFPEMRADGAALATALAKVVSFVFALLVLLCADSEINFKYGIKKNFDPMIKKRLLPIGLTAAGEQVILQAGAVLTAKIISVLSTEDIAANQIVANLEGFAWLSGSASQIATTSLFGRSLGENNIPKAKSYLKLALKFALSFAGAEMLIFCTMGKSLASLFSNDTSLYPIISVLLILSAIPLPFINSHQTVSGALRSAGDSVAPLIASLISLWVFRVILGYVTIRILGYGLYTYKICIAIDQFVRCTIVSIFFLTGHWKRFLNKDQKKKANS